MQLYIKNFQGIGEADIKLKGFTVLTGRSNSGKSSIRRALELVLYNKWDIGYLKTGESQCIVRLNLDDKNYIQIVKPENTYTVMLDGVKNVYPKVGKNTLEELDALGLDYFYDSEGYSHNVHIRSQTDPWYYITSSNQEQSRIIASIFNFDEIKNILKKSYKDKTEVTSRAEDLAQDIDSLKIEGQELAVKLNHLSSLKEKLETKEKLSSFISVSGNINKIVTGMLQIKSDISKMVALVKKLKALSYLVDYEDCILTVNKIQEEISSRNRRVKLIKENITIANRVAKCLEDKAVLESFNSIVEDKEDTITFIEQGKKELSSVIKCVKLARNIVDNLTVKSLIRELLDSNNKVNTLNEDVKYVTENLIIVKTLRNKLVRFSSVTGYVNGTRERRKLKVSIKQTQEQVVKVKGLLARMALYSTLNNLVTDYEEGQKDIGRIAGTLESTRKTLVSINLDIGEAVNVINESILCPHCSKPIGDFIEGCKQ